MNLIKVTERTPTLIDQLTVLWELSVRETHLFLSESELKNIKAVIPQALREIPQLYIIENDRKQPTAFMGVANRKLEMLFVTPDKRGQGLGKRLIQYGVNELAINEVTVNEQNPLAQAFYEHVGFKIYRRTSHDEEGRPYPLLYMRLEESVN